MYKAVDRSDSYSIKLPLSSVRSTVQGVFFPGDQVSMDRVQRNTSENLFDRLPDEVVDKIIDLARFGTISAPDPYNVGWNEEEEMCQEIRATEEALRPLRLVSKRFLRLSAPAFFRQLLIGDQIRNGCPSGNLIVKLAELLSRKPLCHETSKPYGHHVRKLVVLSKGKPPAFIYRLLDTIQTLIPNLTELSSLDLSRFPTPISPAITFPSLESLTEITSACPHLRSTPLGQDLSNSLVAQENFFGILNHHPCIKKLSIRGVCLDLPNGKRLSAVLQSNRLASSLMPSFQRPPYFSGLTELHLGYQSLVDVNLLQKLPSVAPQLQRLHIDAGCQLEDKSAQKDKNWTMIHLLCSLPELSHFTFISKHELPLRNGLTNWARLGGILEAAPKLKSLNVRLDSLESAEIFEGLSMSSLRELNLWHEPIVAAENEESWSIISFQSIQKLNALARIVSSLFQAGLEWPQTEKSRRDLFLKLKHLSPIFENQIEELNLPGMN